MKTVILCGGKGLRIREVSDNLPKPMIKIGEYPILHHIMKIYSKYNFNKFVLCIGYKGEVIINYFKDLPYINSDIFFDYTKKKESFKLDNNIKKWKVQIAQTGLDTKTGFRVNAIKKYINEKNFFATYGDGVGNINLNKLLKFHLSHKKLVTLTSVRPPSRFGEIISKRNQISSFNEKPQVNVGKINGGYYACKKEVFDYFPKNDEQCSFEHDILPKIAKDSQLMSYDHKDFWMPMDTNREYEILNKLWKKNPSIFY
tara:strand:- start:1319 stop:2089 length:771 start_codon:yes stop_codon:yes gene_type:complete